MYLLEIIQREFVYLRYYFMLQLRQIAPYWALGIILGSFISVFVKEHIHKLFRKLGDKKIGIIGIVPASILGIASPLCMYGTIPLAASFSRSGIQDSWLAAFMMSSILLNPQLVLYSTALGSDVLFHVLYVELWQGFLCIYFIMERTFLIFQDLMNQRTRILTL